MDVEAAKEDLNNRSLMPIGYDFGRLVYLSSLRDFSTGQYHHHGLTQCFSESAATAALATCHQDVFNRLVMSPLATLVGQIERFIRSTPQDFEKTMHIWKNLEPYRVLTPTDRDPLTAALFKSNVKVALAIVESRHSVQLKEAQSASPRLSPGR